MASPARTPHLFRLAAGTPDLLFFSLASVRASSPLIVRNTMSIWRRLALISIPCAGFLAGPLASSSGDAELQLQLATLLFEDTRFQEAAVAYRNALASEDPEKQLRARIGLVTSQLRLGEFVAAQRDAKNLRQLAPKSPEAITSYADALWAAGQFDDGEAAWRDALALAPVLPRAAWIGSRPVVEVQARRGAE